MSEPLLEVEALAKRFGGVVGGRRRRPERRRREVRCIIGPNGAGKSTLFNMLAGTLRPSAGRIRFAGRDIAGRPVHAFARLGIARKFQVPSVFASLSVARQPRRRSAQPRSRTARERIASMLTMLALQDSRRASAPARLRTDRSSGWRSAWR